MQGIEEKISSIHETKLKNTPLTDLNAYSDACDDLDKYIKEMED